MRIVVIGLGYIGLPTSIMFSMSGADVLGVDTSAEIVDQLNRGEVHIKEPGIQDKLKKVLETKKFRASVIPDKGDAFIISVPTPSKNDPFPSCDLHHVKEAVEGILPYLEKGNTVVIESTVPPRTTEDTVLPLLEQAGFTIGQDIFLVHCPERVMPGQIFNELQSNNRIIGGITAACTARGKKIYELFVKGELITANAKTAELSKLMENTYRDVNIALANELVKIGNSLSIDALDVIKMANKHPRVSIHDPGPGVGGHCLAVDPYFIIEKASEVTPLIKEARAINKGMPEYVTGKVISLMKKKLGKTITILGIAYKGNSDDVRESPALEIIKLLERKTDYQIRIYDPHVKQKNAEQDLKQALLGSDLVLVLCDHGEFKQIPSSYIQGMKQAVLLDTKNTVQNKDDFVQHYSFGNLFEI